MTPEPLLKNQKLLAQGLGVSVEWIRAMRREGFPMPGGRSTIEKALVWLDEHPSFRVSASLSKKSPKRRDWRVVV